MKKSKATPHNSRLAAQAPLRQMPHLARRIGT